MGTGAHLKPFNLLSNLSFGIADACIFGTYTPAFISRTLQAGANHDGHYWYPTSSPILILTIQLLLEVLSAFLKEAIGVKACF